MSAKIWTHTINILSNLYCKILSEEDGNKLQQLLEQDTTICDEYKKNLSNEDTKMFFAKDQLKKYSHDFIQDQLGKDKKGKCTVTLKYPDIIPIGQTCEIAETCRAVAEAREGPNAYKINLELVVQGITLQKKLQCYLGFKVGPIHLH